MNYPLSCRKLFSLVLLFIVLGFSLIAQEEPLVREIVFEGLRTVSEDDVLGVMRTRVGERSTPEMRSEDIKAISELGFFSGDIHFYREELEDGIRIIVSLEENPLVEEILVIGNQAFKSSKILASIPFKKGDILPFGAAFKARFEVEKLYSRAGYKNAHVSVRTEEPVEGKAIVTIVVDEGRKILVKDLVIRGNESYSAFRLRFLLDNKGSWAFIRNFYDETTFEEDLDILRHFYTNRGFLDVLVKRGKPEYNEDKGWIRPVILIEEGPRYRVSEVAPKNATLFTEGEIVECFSKMMGEYFNANRYRKGLEKLRELYGDEGYIQLEVKTDFERLPGEDAIRIALNLKENNRVYVGKIKVRRQGYRREEAESAMGKLYDKVSPAPKDEVILREVILEPGEVYRNFQEVRTVERLKRLEIFEGVSITREPTEEKDVRDAVINVKEGVTGNLLFGIGYGESPGAYFQVRLHERNLFGDARDLRMRALIGTRLSAMYIGYLDRYFRDTDSSLEWEIYRERYGRGPYDERVYGSTLELGKPLSEYVRAYMRLRLEHVNFYDEDDDIIEEDFDSYPVASARFRIVEDRRDEIWWPKRGFTRSGSIELGYADGLLAKLGADFTYYNNFYKDLVYAVHFSGGLMPYSADKVGLTERFYLGGANDLRGFSFRGAGPKDSGEDDMPLGGSTKLLLKNELRYPIYGDLKGVLFLDAGMLDETVGLDAPRVSVGTGFRMKISIIRLYLDFAKALHKRSRDDTQFVHFRLGASF